LVSLLSLSLFTNEDNGTDGRFFGIRQSFSFLYERLAAKYAQNLTDGQSNLIQGRIAAANGSFTRIGQVAPTCNPYMVPWALCLPFGVLIGSFVFAKLTGVPKT